MGCTDEALLDDASKKLREQALPFLPDLIFSSPLLRCVQTAELLLHPAASFFVEVVSPFLSGSVKEKDGTSRQAVPVFIKEELKETDFGDFEYKNYEELKEEPAYQAWIDSGGQTAFPGGESPAEFRDRAVAAFNACLEEAKKLQAERVVIVTHGGVIMAVMERYGTPKADFYDWQVKNGEGYLLNL